MKKLSALFLTLCLCLSLSACSNKSGAKEISPGVVEVDGCRVEIYGYYERAQTTTFAGFVYIKFTNNSGESCSMSDKVEIRAFQNGTECNDYYSAFPLFSVDSDDDVLNGVTAETGSAFKVKKGVPVLVQIVVDGKVISEKTVKSSK